MRRLIVAGLFLAACNGSTSSTTVAPTTTIVTLTTGVPSTDTTPPDPSTTVAPTTTTTLAPLSGLDLETVGEGFSEPILLIARPDDGARLVMERGGVVKTLDDAQVWFDISARVNSEDGIEPGMLGMAFHPDYLRNGRLFVFYYRSGIERTRLAEFRVNAGVVDVDSEKSLLEIEKPTNRHNGGMLQFGPDGYLYLSTGEGGKASINAQNPQTLLGKVIRLDVDRGDPYAIPAGNPFREEGGAPEVIAYGLRNPWRYWIDASTGTIYIADVGQQDWEEVNVVSLDDLPGLNFGWLRMEGTHCFQPGCDPVAEGLTLPVVEYPHSEGCSVTGGVVYRGEAIPEITGRYFYADWCAGWVRSFRWEEGAVLDRQENFTDAGQVNGFGVDADGEIYLLTFGGEVKRLVALRSG